MRPVITFTDRLRAVRARRLPGGDAPVLPGRADHRHLATRCRGTRSATAPGRSSSPCRTCRSGSTSRWSTRASARIGWRSALRTGRGDILRRPGQRPADRGGGGARRDRRGARAREPRADAAGRLEQLPRARHLRARSPATWPPASPFESVGPVVPMDAPGPAAGGPADHRRRRARVGDRPRPDLRQRDLRRDARRPRGGDRAAGPGPAARRSSSRRTTGAPPSRSGRPGRGRSATSRSARRCSTADSEGHAGAGRQPGRRGRGGSGSSSTGRFGSGPADRAATTGVLLVDHGGLGVDSPPPHRRRANTMRIPLRVAVPGVRRDPRRRVQRRRRHRRRPIADRGRPRRRRVPRPAAPSHAHRRRRTPAPRTTSPSSPPGTLTIGTDNPAYPPYFDPDPAASAPGSWATRPTARASRARSPTPSPTSSASPRTRSPGWPSSSTTPTRRAPRPSTSTSTRSRTRPNGPRPSTCRTATTS